MYPLRSFGIWPRLWVWVAVLIGMLAVSIDARVAAGSPADSVRVPSGDLPPTLTALRIEILTPPTCPSRRRSRSDRWFARDKARHVVFSGLWTLSTQYVLVKKADWSTGDALPVSVATSAAVGLGKEFYDASRDGQASGKDLVANVVGIGLAVGVIAL